MRQKISVAPGQPPKEAELVDLEESKEGWSEYKLADGVTIRLKQVVTEVWRILEEFDPEGNPQYFVKSVGVMTVLAPESAKKRTH